MQVLRCSRAGLRGTRRCPRPNLVGPRMSALQRRCFVDLVSLDTKWRRVWKESRREPSQEDGDGRKSSYILPMFPYPSGTLHLGHLRVYTIADVVARYHALKGHRVILPMGWDAFGLPAENAALERGVAPSTWTRDNIAKMRSQLDLMNGSWDWSRELTTCSPDFYKHTQKIFLLLHQRGLAYQAEAEVNYDPVDKTVLANEQVDASGRSWRSGAVVERRRLKQWFLRISHFSQELFQDLDGLAEDGAWPEHVIAQQRHWLGRPADGEQWRLRDWLISRQRYWGTPIPIVHCGECGAVPVPEEQLPVLLPEVTAHWAQGKPGNALDSCPGFVDTQCPSCGGAARRDTDTMDTFVDSSWYYARFVDPHNSLQPFSPEAARHLPVDIYVGGVEHAILHLLYARFIYKFLGTTPLLPVTKPAEPFKRLITQGMVHGKTYVDPSGRFLRPEEVDLSEPLTPRVASTGQPVSASYEKMSKSKHNGVDPTAFIARYGADATRAHMLFQAPVAETLNWDESKIPGVVRWLHKLHEQVSSLATISISETNDEEEADAALWRETQRKIDTITRGYEKVYTLNVVVSDLMTLTNHLTRSPASPAMKKQVADVIVRLAAPIAPAVAEECWILLHPNSPSLFKTATLPVQDGSLLLHDESSMTCAVQINGKLRGTARIAKPPAGLGQEELGAWVQEAILATEEGGKSFGEGGYDVRKAKRVVAVKGGRVMNFVI